MQFRSKADGLSKELSRLTPISWAQQMQLLMDVLMVLTPPALAHSFETKREGLTVYLWPALGSMLLAAFFQGALRVISAMEYPFGNDLDDIHLDWCLMSSEKAIFSYLSCAVPCQPKHAAAGKTLSVEDVEDEPEPGKQKQDKQL